MINSSTPVGMCCLQARGGDTFLRLNCSDCMSRQESVDHQWLSKNERRNYSGDGIHLIDLLSPVCLRITSTLFVMQVHLSACQTPITMVSESSTDIEVSSIKPQGIWQYPRLTEPQLRRLKCLVRGCPGSCWRVPVRCRNSKAMLSPVGTGASGAQHCKWQACTPNPNFPLVLAAVSTPERTALCISLCVQSVAVFAVTLAQPRCLARCPFTLAHAHAISATYSFLLLEISEACKKHSHTIAIAHAASRQEASVCS